MAELAVEPATDLAARYARAESLLHHNMLKLVDTGRVTPVWIEGTETFWYARTTRAGTQVMVVDAEARTKRPAFDHERVAAALDLDAAALPLDGLELRDGAVRIVVGEQRFEVSLDTYEATVVGSAPGNETVSPDGRWAVGFTEDEHNLYVRDLEQDETRPLTTDGVDAFEYGGMTDPVKGLVSRQNLGHKAAPLVVWSPDSSKFVTHRIDQRQVEFMHLVRSSPFDGGRPQALSYRYSLVGDEQLAHAEFFVFDAATEEMTPAQTEPLLMPFVPAIAYGWVWWNDEGTLVYFLAGERGDKAFRLHELDAATGAVRVIHEETSETNVLFGPYHMQRELRVLRNGDVLVWSERSGWGHLYLHDTAGNVTTITSGEWLVRAIVSVDEDERRILFTAAGREPGGDPYLQELYSVSFDGGEITTVTADGLDHDPYPSHSSRFFVDVASAVDVPGLSVLRDSTGKVVLELEQADATALYATGWAPPERVKVKAADGVTDIWCAIYKPFDFDPAKSYPVVDEVYPGPQLSTAARRFPRSGGGYTGERHGTTFAALGLAAVSVDGRGSALRHKAFQDHARLVSDTDYVDDHVAAIRQLAETRPWMDLDRVGIYGHSAGAYASTRAILWRPDFFKVAVSSSGDHDDRINHQWWGEKFFGLVDEFDYEHHSNTSLADRLEGKLFLVHGEMDDNATPHGTIRLVDALIKANKDFDLLIVPNADHSLHVNNAYWLRKRWDYFVRHLLGETPPEYRLADVPLISPFA